MSADDKLLEGRESVLDELAAIARRDVAVAEVLAERDRQEATCAEKRAVGFVWRTCADPGLPWGERLAVLGEEFGEVCRELCDARADDREPGPNLRVELVQLAAVVLACVEATEATS